MTRDEPTISLNMPATLVEKLDIIAKQKDLERTDIIFYACAYYCQFHDMNSELFPVTMRNIFFNLARHDDEFRKILREVLRDEPQADPDKRK